MKSQALRKNLLGKCAVQRFYTDKALIPRSVSGLCFVKTADLR